MNCDTTKLNCFVEKKSWLSVKVKLDQEGNRKYKYEMEDRLTYSIVMG